MPDSSAQLRLPNFVSSFRMVEITDAQGIEWQLVENAMRAGVILYDEAQGFKLRLVRRSQPDREGRRDFMVLRAPAKRRTCQSKCVVVHTL